MDSRIKTRFINQTLKEEGGRFLQRQARQIEVKTTSRTGSLLNRRSVSVFGSNGDFSAKLVFDFPIHERFLDIVHIGGSDKGKRRYLHNRPVMRMYNRIAERLMTEFTEATQARLRQEIEDIKRRFSQ